MIVLAHFGHWYVSLPVFMGPVLILFAWVYVGGWLERRKGKQRDRR